MDELYNELWLMELMESSLEPFLRHFRQSFTYIFCYLDLP
jgi:hypothetical protein